MNGTTELVIAFDFHWIFDKKINEMNCQQVSQWKKSANKSNFLDEYFLAALCLEYFVNYTKFLQYSSTLSCFFNSTLNYFFSSVSDNHYDSQANP